MSEADDTLSAAFRAYQARVVSFLRARTDDATAEDIAQQVFLEAWPTLSDPARRPDSTLGWLYAVATRRLIDELRRRERSPVVSGLPDLVTNSDEPARYGSAVRSALTRAINQLPLDQRTVVARRLLLGESFAEIGESLDVSEEACRMRFSRALRHVRAELERAALSDGPEQEE